MRIRSDWKRSEKKAPYSCTVYVLTTVLFLSLVTALLSSRSLLFESLLNILDTWNQDHTPWSCKNFLVSNLQYDCHSCCNCWQNSSEWAKTSLLSMHSVISLWNSFFLIPCLVNFSTFALSFLQNKIIGVVRAH